MRTSWFLLFLVPALALSACKATVDRTPGDGAASSATTEEEEIAALLGGTYHSDIADFTWDALHDGKPKVLFFFASWCPICQRQDKELLRLYAEGGFPLSVYKVDYDKEKSLKLSYGVTYQHTFVLVDGDGKFLRRLEAPDETTLVRLLQTPP